VYPARPDAGPANPVFGLPELQEDPAAALAGLKGAQTRT
jgi:hypothetical protein